LSLPSHPDCRATPKMPRDSTSLDGTLKAADSDEADRSQILQIKRIDARTGFGLALHLFAQTNWSFGCDSQQLGGFNIEGDRELTNNFQPRVNAPFSSWLK
jgi:hypothetical protein